MDSRSIYVVWGCALSLATACMTPAWAAGPEAIASVEPPAAVFDGAHSAAWLQPIRSDRPIRRMSALKTEYRRIRELRREQMQPEYERRLAMSGEDAAEAWREETLKNVARRDLRALRARLDR
ncbi:conserved exported hypothetical protein [Luteimonas sp. 9C]|uniref:hypothetical protein n=1 Tax=Luteimonas sp. 9C TaxID=2653148 RepID=UPI0012F25A3B|nr:hypothetical protein [Luteimonas sp. 9C]VXB40435.1 conserved exported hypothetical protein [Luteimonas sp. 9C]